MPSLQTSCCRQCGLYLSPPTGALPGFSPQVGNAFTFDEHLVGSLTRIQADTATCGPGGGATPPGSTSTGLQALSWTSTKRGISRVISCEDCMLKDRGCDCCNCSVIVARPAEGAALKSLDSALPGVPATCACLHACGAEPCCEWPSAVLIHAAHAARPGVDH